MTTAAWNYRRDYVRPCRFCHRPIEGAARNQVLHPACRTRACAIRFKRRREIRRAARGLFPGEKVALEKLTLGRSKPTRRTAGRWYRWHTCETQDCGCRFLAGHRARFCELCARRRRRADNARRGNAYILRHHPERADRLGIRLRARTLAPPAPPA